MNKGRKNLKASSASSGALALCEMHMGGLSRTAFPSSTLSENLIDDDIA